MSRNVDCIVLGAGFVGLGAALALQARGRSVAIVDRHSAAAGETSFGNTGILQSEAVFPYTFPRRPGDIFRAALNRDPRAQVRYAALPGVAGALWRYFRASAAGPRAKSARALRALVAPAIEAHLEIAEPAGAGALLRGGGWIKLFRTRRGADSGLADAEAARPFGVPSEPLDRDGLLALEPHLGEAAIGGVHYGDPLSTPNPAALAAAYLDLFQRRGGVMARGDARSTAQHSARWRVATDAGPIEAREAVVALGPWSGAFAQNFGYRLPFFVKRGYHMHYAPRGNSGMTRPVVDYERGYAMAPMAAGLRLTSGAEFAGVEDAAEPAFLNRLEPMAREVFPIAERRDAEPWLGRRPCLPDMLPVIGPAPHHKGLWFDFGHQHLGLTLGPSSGRLLAEMMTGETPFADPAAYAATRF